MWRVLQQHPTHLSLYESDVVSIRLEVEVSVAHNDNLAGVFVEVPAMILKCWQLHKQTRGLSDKTGTFSFIINKIEIPSHIH